MALQLSLIIDLGQPHYCSEKSDFSTFCQEAYLIGRNVSRGSLLLKAGFYLHCNKASFLVFFKLIGKCNYGSYSMDPIMVSVLGTV